MNMLILLIWIAGLTFAIGVIVGEHLQRAREEIVKEAVEARLRELVKRMYKPDGLTDLQVAREAYRMDREDVGGK